MRNSVVLASTILLLAALYTGSHAVSIKLSALRPDLEFLRGTWIQNPNNTDLPGRIIYTNKTEILVKFEHFPNLHGTSCPSDSAVEAWIEDSLQVENIDTAVSVLFYKHGNFYIRRYRCDLPEILDKDSWIKSLPIKPENDRKESIEVRYISLKTLGKEIDEQISAIDSSHSGMNGLILKSFKSSAVSVTIEDNEFAFQYKKGHRFVDIRNVRIMGFPPKSNENVFDEKVLLYKGPEHFVDFAATNDYRSILYDRRLKTFSYVGEKLDSRWMIRSNSGNAVLRIGSGSDFGTVCVPPHLCGAKRDMLSQNMPFKI